jgi:uncharacterized membrane protein
MECGDGSGDDEIFDDELDHLVFVLRDRVSVIFGVMVAIRRVHTTPIADVMAATITEVVIGAWLAAVVARLVRCVDAAHFAITT